MFNSWIRLKLMFKSWPRLKLTFKSCKGLKWKFDSWCWMKVEWHLCLTADIDGNESWNRLKFILKVELDWNESFNIWRRLKFWKLTMLDSRERCSWEERCSFDAVRPKSWKASKESRTRLERKMPAYPENKTTWVWKRFNVNYIRMLWQTHYYFSFSYNLREKQKF